MIPGLLSIPAFCKDSENQQPAVDEKCSCEKSCKSWFEIFLSKNTILLAELLFSCKVLKNITDF